MFIVPSRVATTLEGTALPNSIREGSVKSLFGQQQLLTMYMAVLGRKHVAQLMDLLEPVREERAKVPMVCYFRLLKG